MSNLPLNWCSTALSELCDRIVDGSHNPPKGVESGHAMLSARNINNHEINFDAFRWISDSDFETENRRTQVAPGDVLLTIVGTIGRTAVVPALAQPFALQRSVAVLKPSVIDARYLAYAIDTPSQQQWLIDNAKGTAQKGIYLKVLGTARIPVAPLAEQTRIVEKLEDLLSDLDAGVAELKAAQRKLAQYRQSLVKAAVEGALTADWRAARTQSGEPNEGGAELLQRILTERRARWEAKQRAKFHEQGKELPHGWQTKYVEPSPPATTDLPSIPDGWVWSSAGQVLADIETGKSFKCDERPPLPHEVGVVKVSAVSWGEYDENESKTCTDVDRVNDALMISPGDFLFSRANTIELVGACVVARDVSLSVMLSDKILRFVMADDLKMWLLAMFRSDAGRRQIEALSSGNQDSMRNIGQERIRQIVIPLPPPIEMAVIQDLLSDGLEAATAQNLAIQHGLKQAAAQRKNLLKAAFAGQLVPQDATDEPASVLLDRIRTERATGVPSGKQRGRKAKETA